MIATSRKQRAETPAPVPVADVCLVLEGTYPYVAGGVSSWLHHLVTHMPELTFHVLHLSPCPGHYAGRTAYTVPANVVAVSEVFLHQPTRVTRRRRRTAAASRAVLGAFERLRLGDPGAFEELVAMLQRLPPHVETGDLLLERGGWCELVAAYEREASGESFLDYFWNWFYVHQPFVNALRAPLPDARLYHTISTGYAGLLAAAAGLARGRPMILTEHGIYAKERRIEVHAAEWITDREPDLLDIPRETPFFRRFWDRQFALMSRICYGHAEEIFTLFRGNADEQVREGADPAKLRIIPNGIDVRRFARQEEPAKRDRFTIGFVGRVCPIKDVRTLLAAMRLVVKVVPTALLRILGPTDEDPEYAEDCRRLAAAFGLDDNVRFEGHKVVDGELAKLDVVVLTSISEAQPLIVLEAGAAGVPVVTTDVGCCRELIEGRTPDDRKLGAGGIVTAIASPAATAAALVELHDHPELRTRMGQSLRRRVARHYDQGSMVDRYRETYGVYLEPSEED